MGAIYCYNGLLLPKLPHYVGIGAEAGLLYRAEGGLRAVQSNYTNTSQVFNYDPVTGRIYTQHGTAKVYELRDGAWVRRSDLDFGVDTPVIPGEALLWCNAEIETRKVDYLYPFGTGTYWPEDPEGVLVSDDSFVLEALPEDCPPVVGTGETGIIPGARIRNITTGEVVDISGEAEYAVAEDQAGFARLGEDRQLVLLEEADCGSIRVHVTWHRLPDQVAVLTVPVGDPAVRKGRFWVGFAAGAAMCGAPVGRNREAAGEGGSGGWTKERWTGFACGAAVGGLMTERL